MKSLFDINDGLHSGLDRVRTNLNTANLNTAQLKRETAHLKELEMPDFDTD